MASSICKFGASGVRRSSIELAGGNLIVVTGSGDFWIAGAGISGWVGKVICIGSGMPASIWPSSCGSSPGTLVMAGTGDATGLGSGVGNPAGSGARGAGVGVGTGVAASSDSAIGKFSCMMAETSGGAAGEAAGVGCWATARPPKTSRAATRPAPKENVFTSPVLKPFPRVRAKFFRCCPEEVQRWGGWASGPTAG